MKRPLMALILFLVASLLGCQAPPAVQTPSVEGVASGDIVSSNTAANERRSAVLWVKGLACPFCTYNVERQLRKVPGVKSVAVTLETGKVRVVVSKEQPPSEEQLRKAIKESGFTVDRVEMP